MKTELSIKAAIYLRAAELVEQGHCKNSLAKDKNGYGTLPDSPSAVAWCLVGAIHKACTEIEAEVPYYHAAFNMEPVSWNNALDTTAAMVAQKLREQAFA